MRNFKNIIKLSSLLALCAMVGCEKDDNMLDYVCDTAWYTSEIAKTNTERYQLNVGSTIYFMDASQGVISREWSIDSSKATFLIDNYDPDGDATEQLATEKGSTSSNEVEGVYFGEPGATTVTLTTRFNDWVTSHDGSGNEAYYVESAGCWEIKTVYSVTVFDPLQPAFRVTTYDVEGEVDQQLELMGGETLSSNKAFEVETGDILYFEDLTTEVGYEEGDSFNANYAYSRLWSIDSSTYTDEAVSVSFTQTGVYSGFTLKSSRNTPTNNVTKTIPLTVTVKTPDPAIKSVSLSSTSNKVITASTNFEVTGVENYGFTIKITDKDGVDRSEEYSIESVGVASGVMGIDITLDDYIYEGDIVKLSYDPNAEGASITTTGGAEQTVDEVIDRSVKHSIGEALTASAYGFDETTTSTFTSGDGTSLWYTGTTFVTSCYRTTDPDDESNYVAVFDNSLNALSSVSAEVGVNLKNSLAVTIPAGSYVFSYKIYIDSDVDITTSGSTDSAADGCYSLTRQINLTGGFLALDAAENIAYPTGAENRNKWITVEHQMTSDVAITKFQPKFTVARAADNAYVGNTLPDGVKIYFDDVKLTPKRTTTTD